MKEILYTKSEFDRCNYPMVSPMFCPPHISRSEFPLRPTFGVPAIHASQLCPAIRARHAAAGGMRVALCRASETLASLKREKARGRKVLPSIP